MGLLPTPPKRSFRGKPPRARHRVLRMSPHRGGESRTPDHRVSLHRVAEGWRPNCRASLLPDRRRFPTPRYCSPGSGESSHRGFQRDSHRGIGRAYRYRSVAQESPQKGLRPRDRCSRARRCRHLHRWNTQTGTAARYRKLARSTRDVSLPNPTGNWRSCREEVALPLIAAAPRSRFHFVRQGLHQSSQQKRPPRQIAHRHSNRRESAVARPDLAHFQSRDKLDLASHRSRSLAELRPEDRRNHHHSTSPAPATEVPKLAAA